MFSYINNLEQKEVVKKRQTSKEGGTKMGKIKKNKKMRKSMPKSSFKINSFRTKNLNDYKVIQNSSEIKMRLPQSVKNIGRVPKTRELF